LEVVAVAFTVSTTVSRVVPHAPPLIVQTKVYVPGVIPVTVVDGVEVDVMVPGILPTLDHVPLYGEDSLADEKNGRG
jgi:hypothetical protein